MRPCRRRDSENSKTEIFSHYYTQKPTKKQTRKWSLAPLLRLPSPTTGCRDRKGAELGKESMPSATLTFPPHTHTVLRNPGSSANAVRARLQRTNSPALNNCNNQVCVHCAGHKCKIRRIIADYRYG